MIIHQHLNQTLTLMIAGHRVGHYSAEGKLLTPLTKKQIKATSTPGSCAFMPIVASVSLLYIRGFLTRSSCLTDGGPRIPQDPTSICCLRLEESAQKIEFVSSASPETIRREPPEFDLLRSVA